MISDYNNAIVPKIEEFIQYMLARIEASYTEGASIRLSKYEVVDSNNLDVNYLMTNSLTGSITVKFHFEVKLGDDSPIEMWDDLDIPKIINNVFIIEGSMRVPTNSLENDNSITVYDQNIRINEMINFSFEEDSHYNDGYKITLFIRDDDEDTVLDFTDEISSQYKGYLKLQQFEIDKLKVKLDTDSIPQYITRSLIIDLIKLGPDKSHDNLIDKKIYSPESSLMRYLYSSDIRSKILRNMKQKFNQYQTIFLRDIQNAINRYFKVANESNIEIPTTVNPLIFDALKYKVRIPINVAYNETMTDIIDIVNTPINGNSNQINELTVCTEIRDNVIYIKCYKYSDFSNVTVPYSHYCTKKVIINQFWDYDSNKFKDGLKTIKYKLRNKIYEGSISDQYDYIEPKPDNKLSFTTRRIPLVNMSDFGRLAMGTAMSKQAVELLRSEPSLVTSGHDDIDYLSSVLITRHKGGDCIVKAIKDNNIYLEDTKSKSVTFVEIPNPTMGQNDTLISFDSKVKVGDKVSDGDILVIPHMLRRNSFELGLNTRVVYMNYLGYVHEDGLVISESYANRLTHYSLIDVSLEIRPDDIIDYIIPIGSRIKSKDNLVSNKSRLRVSKTVRDTYLENSGLLQGIGIQFYPNNLVTPNNILEGYVLDVKIHIEPDREITSEVTKKTFEDYTRLEKSHDYDFLDESYKSIPAAPQEFNERSSGYISMKLLVVHKAIIGSKLTNRYGSKSEISLILPDECMPRICSSLDDPNGLPAEAILNPAAVVSRKNISQLYEAAMGKCIQEIYNRLPKMLLDESFESVLAFLHKFYGGKFDSFTKEQLTKHISDKGIFGFRMDVGCYAKISYDQVISWLNDLNLTDINYIYCPDVCICETKTGLKGYPLESYTKKDGDTNIIKYELGWCENQCIAGNEYMMKLFHSADYSAKMTSSIMDTKEPVMGYGRWRLDGQSIGEMEMWSLMEYGTEKFVQAKADRMLTSQYVFLNELLLSGYTMVNNEGIPLLSNQGQKLAKLNELQKS